VRRGTIGCHLCGRQGAAAMLASRALVDLRGLEKLDLAPDSRYKERS